MTVEQTYGIDDFVKDLGADHAETAAIAEEATKYDFSFQWLTPVDRDQVILGVLRKLDSFAKVGAHRHQIWERCWADAKATFRDADEDLVALDPVFMGATPIVRLHRDYARPKDSGFETHWFKVMRRWLFARYLTGATKAFEFGCGSGFNLAAAGQMFPGIELRGLDWSPSAVELVDSIGQRYGFNLTGQRFDFFNPDPDVPVGPDTVVMTFAALEQTGERFVTFVEWLLSKRPKLVVSMEPILEFYDPTVLSDYLAIRYHTQREYLKGYCSWVKTQADAGRAEIVNSLRPGFGSLYHEGYGLVVWRPV